MRCYTLWLKMKLYHVASFSEFDLLISGPPALYRGVSNSQYALITKVGRNARHAREEVQFFDQFKRLAEPYLTRRPSTDWEWLALAQHHGLPTRLMDWTRNRLVAAFFAVRNSAINCDCAVFVLEVASPLLTQIIGEGPLTDIWRVDESVCT